MSIIGEQREG